MRGVGRGGKVAQAAVAACAGRDVTRRHSSRAGLVLAPATRDASANRVRATRCGDTRLGLDKLRATITR